jgi:hypothetical protein
MPAYDAIYGRLTGAVGMRSVTARFVMETLRKRPDLPLRETPPPPGGAKRAGQPPLRNGAAARALPPAAAPRLSRAGPAAT